LTNADIFIVKSNFFNKYSLLLEHLFVSFMKFY
jgi:hypothetical protein